MATISSVTVNAANMWIPLPDEMASPDALAPIRAIDDRATALGCSHAACNGTALYAVGNRWACSEACLQQLLRATIAEQSEDTAVLPGAAPRVQLGRILIEQGSITEAQLEHALRSQRATGAGRLGCWLRQQVDLAEADFAAALSIQWRCPVYRVGNFSAARMAGFLPRLLVEQHGALPLRVTGDPARLSVCFEDHVDGSLLLALERMHGLSVEAGLLTASDFWQVTRELVGVSSVPSIAVVSSSTDCMTQAMSRMLVRARAKKATLVVVDDQYWLRFWRSKVDQPAEPVSAAWAGTDAHQWPMLPNRSLPVSEWPESLNLHDVICSISEDGPGEFGGDAEVSRLVGQMLLGMG